MKFKTIILIFLLFSCSSNYTKLDKREPYNSKGFAYITEEEKLKENSPKLVNNNSKQRAFNKFLRPNTLMKIINPDTKDYIILKNSKEYIKSNFIEENKGVYTTTKSGKFLADGIASNMFIIDLN